MSNLIKYDIPKCSTGESFDLSRSAFSDSTGNYRSFSIPQCARLPDTIYYSAPYTASCDVGYSGSDVVVPGGQFTSTISQEEADNAAILYGDSQLSCTLIPQDPIMRPFLPLFTSTGRMFVHGYYNSSGTLYEIGEDGLHEVVATGLPYWDSIIEASDGNYYATSKSNGTITKITPSIQITTLATGLGKPYGICQGQDGALYTGPASDGGGYIWRVALSGAKSSYYAVHELYSDYRSLVPASDGYIYACEYAFAHTGFEKIQSAGLGSYYYSSDVGNTDSFLQGDDGYFYTVSYTSGKVCRVTDNGVYSVIATIPINTPYATLYLIEHSSGDLYVLTAGNPTSRIFKVTKAGVVTLLHTFAGTGFSHYGIYEGFNNDVFVCGYLDNKVYRYSISTGLTTAFS